MRAKNKIWGLRLGSRKEEPKWDVTCGFKMGRFYLKYSDFFFSPAHSNEERTSKTRQVSHQYKQDESSVLALSQGSDSWPWITKLALGMQAWCGTFESHAVGKWGGSSHLVGSLEMVHRMERPESLTKGRVQMMSRA